MGTRLTLRKILIALTISALVCCCETVFADQSDPNAGAANNVSLIFIQQADSGILSRMSGRPGYYSLTLYGVSPYITYVSTRPNRLRGIFPTQSFINSWGSGDNNFQQVNPNVTITASQVNGQLNQNTTLELAILSNPQYDMAHNMLRFMAKPLYLSSFELEEIRFNYITLFFIC